MARSGERARPTPNQPPTAAVEGEVLPPVERREIDGRKVVVRLVGVIARIPRYIKLGWRLMKEPAVSRRGKAALGGGLAYALSPIDPIPGFIPIIGQLDDLAVLVLGVRTALRSAPPDVAEGHLREASLSWDTIERDVVTIRATTVWLTRGGAALLGRLGRAMLGVASRQLRAALARRDAAEIASPS
jgi:uncharacterized membrane protein YkvA (DUF1232 family)